MDELPNAKIRATTVAPNADGLFVEAEVSDAETPPDASAAATPPTVRLSVGVQIPTSHLPTLASIQREALRLAECILAALGRLIDEEIRGGRGSR